MVNKRITESLSDPLWGDMRTGIGNPAYDGKGTKDMAHSQDLKDSQRTYAGFIGTLKWAVPLVAAITLFVVILIA